jgi:hypothetical protein
MVDRVEAPNGRRFANSPIKFNPEVNLGHILQIVALTGAVITGYVSLQKDLATLRADEQVAMAGFNGRLSVAEAAIAERRSEEREFAAEMRATLADIQRALTDLKVQAVERARAPK